MIREDDEDIGGLPSRLRWGATDGDHWDVPGLMMDAAERIEWLERSCAEMAGDSIKARFACDERIEKAAQHVSRWRDAAEIEHGRVLELRELVRHAWKFLGYPSCGFGEMTAEQKSLFLEITEAKVNKP